jgi:hypothetical protein
LIDKLVSRKFFNNEVAKVLKASDNWLSRLEKSEYEPNLENQSGKFVNLFGTKEL